MSNFTNGSFHSTNQSIYCCWQEDVGVAGAGGVPRHPRVAGGQHLHHARPHRPPIHRHLQPHPPLQVHSAADYYFRYLPLQFLRSYLHRRSGSGYLSILIILFVSSCVNATRFLEYRSQRIGQQILVLPTDLKLSVAYNIFMSLLNIVLNTCVPLACLLFMNFKIYLAVRQRNELLPRLNMKQVRRFLFATY